MHPQTTPADMHAILAAAQDKIDRFLAIEPHLIDLSMRENPVGARLGQTLEDKLRILPKLREFGFRHIHLGTLDYECPDELETGDDFMASLRDRKVDTATAGSSLRRSREPAGTPRTRTGCVRGYVASRPLRPAVQAGR